MAKDYVLFAIFVAVFFVGFGVGSAVFYNQQSMPILGHGVMSPTYSPELMNQMIGDTNLRKQVINSMMQNPQFMSDLRENQDFMQKLNP